MAQPMMFLSNGLQMPSLGFGTWNLDKSQTAQAVAAALKAGYRHFDCAPIYDNESEVGAALSKAVETGEVQREKLWITSKLWNTCHEKQHVRPALLKSLHDLKLEYLDCFLLHWPMAFEFTGYDLKEPVPLDSNGNPRRAQVTILDTWREMESLVSDGLVRSIGVSNFPVMLLWDLLGGARIPPAINQVECNPRNSCGALRRFCKASGVAVTAYSPFGSTFAPMLDMEEIKQLGVKHQRSEANVVIRWALQKDLSVVVKSWREDRIHANFSSSLDFVLDEEDIAMVDSLDTKTRSLDFSEDWGVDVWG